ncbi:hypothetical protein [Nakamurella flava]|nr:hypothetical protein [Nakamurella flava]
MSRILTSLKQRQETARTRRAVQRAIDSAATPSVRHDLLVMAQRRNLPLG